MHYMIDLETLGTNPATAPIVQIAVVPFTLFDQGPASAPHEWFNVSVRADGQPGREVNIDTLRWWLDTDPTLLRSILNDPAAVSLYEALNGLDQWFRHEGTMRQVDGLWANGPDFDVAMMASAFNQRGQKVPWPYNAARDVRTTCKVFGTWVTDWDNLGMVHPLEAEGKAHDARVDCLRQIRWVQSVVQLVKG